MERGPADRVARRLPRDERRRVIEAAAERLLTERGYAATRLVDVAAAAGVTKQLLQRHFATKAELHLALLSRHRDGVVGQLALMRDEGPLEARVRATLDAWYGYIEDHPYAARLLFRDTTGDPAIMEFHVGLQLSARAATVEMLRSDPEVKIPEDRLDAVAELVRACTVALALWWQERPRTPRSWLVDLNAAFLIAGIRAIGGGDAP